MTKFVNIKFVNNMKNFGFFLASQRQSLGMVVRELASLTGIDAALISKFEKGSRMPTQDNLQNLAEALQIPFDALKKEWLAEKIYRILEDEGSGLEVLTLAESRVEYLNSQKALIVDSLSPSIQQKLLELDRLKAKWDAKRPLNQLQLSKMKEYFHTAYTFESNRIEGNTLTLQETHLVVNEGITIGGKSMREHLEAINHAEAITYVEDLVLDSVAFNARVLSQIHYLILKGIDKEHAGVYRKVPVRISGSTHVPPQPYLLDKLMEDYFRHYQLQRKSMHPVLLAAEMHERLVTIHPFIDGNGRTSRLVMNLILLQNGFTLANLKGDLNARMQYYKALEAVQLENNPEIFYHLVIDTVQDSLEQHLALV